MDRALANITGSSGVDLVAAISKQLMNKICRERLGNEGCIVGYIPWPWDGSTGGDYDADVSPALRDDLSEFEAVKVARHLHAGKEQL
jgi:hypothetical protein